MNSSAAYVVLGVITATLATAACTLALTRPPMADGTPTEPADTTTTVTVPLAPLPDDLTATAAAPAVRGAAIQATEPPAAPTTIALPPHYNIWLMLALCESGGDWYINTGNGFYGGLQFDLETWRVAGGEQYASRADRASVLGQMWTAERVLTLRAGWHMDPWGAWPACSRRLGLR